MAERQEARNKVGAQKATAGSKFCNMLSKLRPPRVKDIFVSEVLYLQDLEFFYEQGQSGEQEHCPVKFDVQTCQGCCSKHKRMTLLVGVDEPLSREQLPQKGGGKTAKELKYRDMSHEHQTEFKKAMNKEWQSFLDLGAVKVVREKDAKAIPKSRVLPTRFILTNKDDDTGKTLIAKARMVCGGPSDPDIAVLRTDAPTADSMEVNLVFLFAASKGWILQAGDISTAFLSGVYDYRALYL